MLKRIINFFKKKKTKEDSKLEEKLRKYFLIKDEVFSISEKGVIIDYYLTLNKLSNDYNIPSSTLYLNIEKKGTYRKGDYEVKICQKY